MRYFDNEGNLKEDVMFGTDSYGEEVIEGELEARTLVMNGEVSADSDAAKIYYARKFSDTTKGNYGIKTMYNRAYA